MKATKVNPATVKVGDRVKYGKEFGTVVKVGENRKYGFGSIAWDGDPIPTESVMMCWSRLTAVKS